LIDTGENVDAESLGTEVRQQSRRKAFRRDASTWTELRSRSYWCRISNWL